MSNASSDGEDNLHDSSGSDFLNKSIFEKFDDAIDHNIDDGEFIEACDVSQSMEHDFQTLHCNSIQHTKTVSEYIADDVFEECEQWRDSSIFKDLTTAVFTPPPNVNYKCYSQSFTKVEKKCLLSQGNSPKAPVTSFSDEIQFDDLSLEFELSDANGKTETSPSDGTNKKLNSTTNKKYEVNSFYGLPERVKSLIFRIKRITALYDWQDECLKLNSVINRKNLIYALPTSGGKTLVAEILMLREITCNKKNAIFVLPFVAIVQEKIQSMAPFAVELDFLVEEYAGSKGQYPPIKRRRKNSLYVCTIEKSLGLINSLIETGRLTEIGMIVVDELHLLGEDGGRGATLEGLLTKLMYINAGIHIIGMSATIGNLNEVAEFLKADVYTRNFRPVELKEHLKCENRIWLINTQEEEIFTDEKIINYRYSESALRLDPDKLGGLVMDVVPKDSCLIFCATRKNCENVALLMTRVLFRSLTTHKAEEKERLLNALKAEGHLCSILSKTIKYGVAYHHSGLTTEERRLVEDGYREGILSVICCTSTLAAGVNLPARRVILRSPYVGSEFINLSRYKQMIGRAGRAGMGEVGESILVCKRNEIERVHDMLTSKMDECLSTLHIEHDRGISNLILSSVMLAIATSRAELHKLVSVSLLGIQAERLGIVVKDVVDKAVLGLMKAHSLKVKKTDNDLNATFVMHSQLGDQLFVEPKPKKEKQTIVLTRRTVLELSPLGKAAMKGSVDLQSAYLLHEDLKIAQKHLVLTNDLHLLYLVTPYDMANRIKPVGSAFYEAIMNLPPSAMEVSRVLGINESAAIKLRDGIMPKNVTLRVVHRFYLTLILYELRQGQAVSAVAEKFQVTRGIIQNVLSAAASFACSVVRFCQELPEFWAFVDFLKTFSKKLVYCCAEELEVLMELPAVKAGRARQLYDAGYKTLQSVAAADPRDLHKQLKYVSRRIVDQMIATANLLLKEKVETLKDEYAELIEGLEATQLT